jgi:hypothetical protein
VQRGRQAVSRCQKHPWGCSPAGSILGTLLVHVARGGKLRVLTWHTHKVANTAVCQTSPTTCLWLVIDKAQLQPPGCLQHFELAGLDVQVSLVQVCPGFTGHQCNVDDEPAQSVVRIVWASALQVLVFTCKACCQANKTDTTAAEPATTYDWLVIGKPNSAIAVRLLTTFRACSSSRVHWTPVQHR